MAWFETRGAKERKAAFKNAVAVAISDGVLDDAELIALAAVATRLGMSKSETTKVLKSPEKVKFVLPRSREESLLQMVDMVVVMMADGIIDQREVELCSMMALAHGFAPQVVPALVEAVIRTVRDGVDPEAELRQYL